jgi:hypothetical protein
MNKETKKILGETHIPKWRKELIACYGKATGVKLYTAACMKFEELLAGRKPQPNKALTIHLLRGILPTLAMYETLLSHGLEQKDALDAIDRLYRVSTRAQARFYAALGRLPFFFAILRMASVATMKKYYPPEGWDTTWIENSKALIAWDMRRCFYLDTLASYGRKELTRCCCSVDDCLYENISPSVVWERTMTLGRGDEVCNFRCRKI